MSPSSAGACEYSAAAFARVTSLSKMEKGSGVAEQQCALDAPRRARRAGMLSVPAQCAALSRRRQHGTESGVTNALLERGVQAIKSVRVPRLRNGAQ